MEMVVQSTLMHFSLLGGRMAGGMSLLQLDLKLMGLVYSQELSFLHPLQHYYSQHSH
jgi:hypothetical protein